MKSMKLGLSAGIGNLSGKVYRSVGSGRGSRYVERARELLRKGMNSGQVAALVGFSDQSHFTPHFKKIMRVTPSEYARGVAARKSYPCAPASSSNIV